MKKMFLVLAVLLTAVGAAFAQIKRPGAVADLGDVQIYHWAAKTVPESDGTLVANLGDARIYYWGQGIFEVSSSKLGMCFRLTFTQKDGWFVVACSSAIVEFTADRVGEAVGNVIESAIAETGYGVIYSKAAGEFASTIASWAAEQGINYLCNSYGY
ncbi:MAG: hypothetical protein K6B43_05840 [Treponema sp.]|nr:hypothetical protein [Treponema sp.]